MTKVFISYRRDDSRYQADRIYKALTALLPRDWVFMDIDSIKPGDDFVEILESWVGKCDILLALIGAGWVNAIDPKTGKRLLDNENDFVRIEVREALKRGIPVVPVMLDGANIPDTAELPDDLKKLVRRHGQFVEFRTFDADVASLIKRLDLGAPKPTPTESAEDRYREEKRIKLSGVIAHNAPEGWFLPGAGNREWFKDFDTGPEMVVVPAGSFMMGSPETEPERDAWGKDCEGPQHKVTIAEPFAVGRCALTFYQWDIAQEDKDWQRITNVAPYKPEDRGWGRGARPVININWHDAKAYVKWLSGKTGKDYRLLSEAEWEYVCRAGTSTPFWWGSSISTDQANYDGNYTYGGGAKGQHRQKTVPAASFDPNPWGLYEVHGNVWEWCEDPWHESYKGSPPNDGTSWQYNGENAFRVGRGGSWYDNPWDLRAAIRNRGDPVDRDINQGFRVARTL